MNTDELQIERRTLGEISILDCAGRIVVRRETEFLFEAATFSIERSRSVLLNLAAVTTIDSGGLGTLVLLKRLAETFSCELALCSVPPRVSEVLKLTGLNKHLPMFRTEDEALRRFIRSMGKAPSRPTTLTAAPDCSAA